MVRSLARVSIGHSRIVAKGVGIPDEVAAYHMADRLIREWAR
jgi:hypothetical protein